MITQPAHVTNYRPGRKAAIDMLVIHVMEGSCRGTAQEFATPLKQVSAHYGIGKDGAVYQYVKDGDTAWHAGSAAINTRSIGIELEGKCADPANFTPAMKQSLGVLAQRLCITYKIPVDRQHIIGHCEVPDPHHPDQRGGAGHHHDPGEFFDWDDFMASIIARHP